MGDSATVFRTTWLCELCGKEHVKTRAMVLVAAAAPPWVYSPEVGLRAAGPWGVRRPYKGGQVR